MENVQDYALSEEIIDLLQTSQYGNYLAIQEGNIIYVKYNDYDSLNAPTNYAVLRYYEGGNLNEDGGSYWYIDIGYTDYSHTKYAGRNMPGFWGQNGNDYLAYVIVYDKICGENNPSLKHLKRG